MSRDARRREHPLINAADPPRRTTQAIQNNK